MQIIKPLRYCEFRLAETQCTSLASVVVHGMSFCDGHHAHLLNELGQVEVTFVEEVFAEVGITDGS